ncbi:protein-arginine deiminase type-2 [Aplochiton taeniatus]
MNISQQQVSQTEIPQFLRKKTKTSQQIMYQRTFRLDIKKTLRTVHVVGTEMKMILNRSAPPNTKFFSVKCSPNVRCSVSPVPKETGKLLPTPLHGNSMLLVTMDAASVSLNESKLSVMYYGSSTEVLAKAVLHLTAVEISLDVDADRDGQVEHNHPNKGSWTWGPNGHGAILLVNCDSERTFGKKLDSEQDQISRVSDLKDMSPMVLRTRGPAELPEGYKLVMHTSKGDAESLRVFRTESPAKERNTLSKLFFSSFVVDYPLVLSSEVLSKEVPYIGGAAESNFHVEGLRFRDKDFDGLIHINLSLLEPSAQGFPETPIFTDRVVFKVSPWIMTPNTLHPIEVFVCSTRDNYDFLKGMTKLIKASGCKVKVCYEYMNRGDRWMQDELEFGYIDSPHQSFPVVLDSPRNGHLENFPYDVLLGPDFGYVNREAIDEKASSLDSFGNLEVSPPVTVNGKAYPLGRILIGVAFPTTLKGRNMTRVVQEFLWAQEVQEPIALFSDWLVVGHVDEFMTFVPAPNRKGFRLLLASPDAGYKLFRRLQSAGHGKAKMFQGLGEDQEITVDEILSDEQLQAENNYVQDCIDWNRDVLKRELGLDEDDIIDLPILFQVLKGEEEEEEEVKRAAAYFPDMVNMIVLGKNLGVPKPFGPQVDGHCAIEKEMCSLMEGLGLHCTFIDDFASYHKLLGEVHCGSNVRRQAFPVKWWHLQP